METKEQIFGDWIRDGDKWRFLVITDNYNKIWIDSVRVDKKAHIL